MRHPEWVEEQRQGTSDEGSWRRIRKIKNGAEAQNRTADTRLFRPLLYQLSYLGIMRGREQAIQ